MATGAAGACDLALDGSLGVREALAGEREEF
jgi:hypothetical protein